MTKISYEGIKREWHGRSVDYDGVYGAQCVDFVDDVLSELGYPIPWCKWSGYARDLWEHRHDNGMLTNCTEVYVMQPGDIAVFKPCNATPLSHVALFDHDAGNGYGYFLGQNQGSSTINIVKMPYSATYPTAFRPNDWKKPQENHDSTGEAVDQVLHVGSYVTTNAMKIGNQGLKKVNGIDCVYLEELGGWVPIEDVTEYDASDGRLDNYLANTNAKVFLTRTRVQQVDKGLNMCKVHGYWVPCGPLIEVR